LKLAVVGAGIVGTATAYELTVDGHEVTVFERRSTIAEEASFATGALVAPGWTADWTASRRDLRMPWSARLDDGLRLATLPRTQEWSWLWQWAQAGKGPRLAQAHRHLHALLNYSQQRQLAITTQRELDHDRSEGMLVLWRDEREAQQAQPALALMRESGIAFKLLDAAQARSLEPALSPETRLHGAVELSGEGAANCREFALLLRAAAQATGCRFEFDTRVEAIEPRAEGRVGVSVRSSEAAGNQEQSPSMQFDGVVVCAGVHAADLLQPLGLHLPLRAVHGQSLSAAVREPLDAPLSAVLDARSGVSIARLGQRVRVAGGQTFGAAPGEPSKASLAQLYQVLADWFPGAVRLGGPRGSIQEWQGAQARLPDGLALIGPSRIPGLWLNLGHGTSGWSTACGSARALADRLQRREPEVDLIGFSPQRYGL
jgi:D-amino-acid dehydrogenase